MRRKMLTLAIITFVAVIISPSYAQEPDKKSVKARENLKEEQKDVVEAKKELKEASIPGTTKDTRKIGPYSRMETNNGTINYYF